MTSHPIVEALAHTLVLGGVLEALRARWGGFELVEHWTQGEFHHDLVVRVPDSDQELPGPVLVIATNCNGGVKELFCFSDVPSRMALWALRCPGNPDFAAEPAIPLAHASTVHWFDPRELLTHDARSELRPEHRVRQKGGGWQPSSNTK